MRFGAFLSVAMNRFVVLRRLIHKGIALKRVIYGARHDAFALGDPLFMRDKKFS